MDDRLTYNELLAEDAELKHRVAELEALVEKLLEAKDRSGKRQAASFSKGPPEKKPQKPGGNSGDDYGTHQLRVIPKQMDETIKVPFPSACPRCDGASISIGLRFHGR